MSAKSILSARALLDYPLYACDFDPFDDSRLVVGGGGGASRTGVGNKITVLAAKAGEAVLLKTAELELPKDEDNVTSLAVGPRRGKATLVYAGVNGSVAEQKRGQNAHFRVVEVAEAQAAEKQPTETACQEGNRISELARTAFFEPEPDPAKPGQTSDIDTYQRLVRVSAPSLSWESGDGTAQLGACATGLAKKAQIALFATSSASSPSPSSPPSVPLLRGLLELDKEATDLDVIQTGRNQFQLAFCSDYQLYTLDVDNSPRREGTEEQLPQLVYTMPEQPTFGSKPVRPAFRAIRYLAPGFLMAVCNLPKRGGVVLMGLRLPDGKDGDSGNNRGNKARLAVNARLPRSVPQATALAVRDLSPPATDGGQQPACKQFVVVVGGSVDNTLSLYTVELQRTGGGANALSLLTNLYPFHTLRHVHEVQMTSIALSHVRPPAAADDAAAVPQYLKLASVSVQNTVAVHYIPLRRVKATSRPSSSSSLAPGYVVALPSRGPSNASLYLFVVLTMVLMLLGAQSILEVRGLARPVLGARAVAPASWLAPYQAPNRGQTTIAAGPADTAIPEVTSALEPEAKYTSEVDVAATPLPIDAVAELLRNAQPDDERKVLLFDGTAEAAAIQAVTHNEAKHGPATEWHELAPEQQAAWRQRLQEAGHWGEDMGETVFRGILFSELAGMVGAMVN